MIRQPFPARASFKTEDSRKTAWLYVYLSTSNDSWVRLNSGNTVRFGTSGAVCPAREMRIALLAVSRFPW